MNETARELLAVCDLTCPICGGVNALQKPVNAEHDEIGVCTICPAVVFTYWSSSNLHRLHEALGETACY